MANPIVEEINKMISELPEDQKELVTDGYHSFKELYDHRVVLFVTLCNKMNDFRLLIEEVSNWTDTLATDMTPWKSKKHFDWTMWDWWFIAWVGTIPGKTLTYHLPISEWDNFLSSEIDNAPEWDWHKSEDVLSLLKTLWTC